MGMSYNERLPFGLNMQDVITKFLEKHFGYKFEAGELGNDVYNAEFIEELENCTFIPKKTKGLRKHGNLLRFEAGGEKYDLTMPDVFMSRNSTSGFYWVEAKSHTKIDDRLIITRRLFDDYALLYTRFTRQSFLVMCITPQASGTGFYDLYYCEMRELLENAPRKTRLFDNDVYVWDIKSVMKRMNTYPIEISRYTQ